MDKKKYIISLVTVMLFVIFYFVFLQYKEAFIIDNSGYFFESNELVEKLNINDLKENDSKINYELIKENQKIYKKGSKFFYGEETKKEIELNFPVISNDATRVTNLIETGYLITEDFRIFETFQNSILANGKLYNGNSLEIVDNENYLLLKTISGLYINSPKIMLYRNKEEIIIKENSIINFMENEIRLYYFENNQFKYERIGAISHDDELKFFESTIRYEDFLINLDILKKTEIDEPLIDDEEEIIKPTKPTNPSIPPDIEDPEYVYVKPDVSAKIKETRVYSLTLDIVLNDPARRIETNPTIEIKLNNRVFVKRVFYSNGTFDISGLLPNTEFEIIGYYTYRDDKDKLLKNTFLDTKIKTKDINNLETLNLLFENNEMFPNKIEFKNLNFDNVITDEVLKGIKNAEIIIGDVTYNISNSIVNNLKKLQTSEYNSPTALKSNTIYDVEFIFYDVAGNVLKINNNKTKVKTSKQRPTVDINITSTDLTFFTSEIKFNNPDDVFLDNIKYILLDSKGSIVSKGNLNKENLRVDDLDVNNIYELSIYADYDIEDGKGVQENVKMRTVKISTKPISTLGFMRLLFEEKNISQHNVKYSVTINKQSVDSKLLELLNEINIVIRNKNNNEIEKEINLNDEIIQNMKNDIAYDLDISNLTSKTEYSIEISAIVSQGSKKFTVQGVANVKSFKTLKKEAIVEIINRYTSGNLIDFDVKIFDIDGAINSNRGILEVRDATGALIGFKNLEINGEYIRLAFDKLTSDEKYTFVYTVEEYNLGYTNATYEQDKILLEEIITTTQGIYGEIYLDSLLKEITSKNMFDLTNNTRWKKDGNSTITDRVTDLNSKSIKMSAKNGYATYAYFLPEGAGKMLKVSFYAKHAISSNMQNIYLSNGGSTNKQFLLEDLNTTYKKYTYVVALSSNNYIGFYIDEIANNNTKTTLEIKEMQIEVMTTQNTNLSDSYHSSGYIFSNTKMFAGNESMPSHSSDNSMIGNEGNGFAKITNLENNTIYNFNYTGGSQSFTVPMTGNYKFEAWGAQGGTRGSYKGGKGAYTSGTIKLNENMVMHIYVGGQGGSNNTTTNVGGYNGGGYSGNNSGATSLGGGGATDFRLIGGNWNNTESIKSRIMIASGGGGASSGSSTEGGAGGSLIGLDGTSSNPTYQTITYIAAGGNQYFAGDSYQSTRSGNLGYAIQSNTSGWGGGGGSGYYGGANGHGRTGAGGSSYISGYRGCISLENKNSSNSNYVDYEEKNTLLATMYANIYDSKNELENKNFYVQIIRNGTLENIYEYEMLGFTSTENYMLKYRLQKNAEYEVRLSVKIRDRYYPINSSYFTTEEEIRTIKTIDDFFSIHTNGKYLVLEDLDFRNVNRSVGFWFSGKIDFQGHKLLLDVDGSANQLMSYIQTDAVLSNMDAHFYLNNQAARSSYYGLFYDFRGRVTNLKITVEEATNVENVNFNLIAYVNRGTVENFVIHNKSGMYGQRWTSLGMMHNYGVLKNGYVYGEDLTVSYPSKYPQESKRVGSLAGYTAENSRIENVFSLIAINGVNPNITENPTIDDRIGSLVGEHNRGILANAYSYTSGSNRNFTRDANIGNYSNVAAQNLFYISDDIYNPAYSLKVAKSVLRDVDFHELLNGEDSFNVNDYVPYGYYPQINWPSSMPNQEFIKLPNIDDADLVDIISVKETKNENNEATAVVIVNNPNKEEIVEIGIKDINKIEILNQVDSGTKSEVTIKLSNPIKYLSKYYMKSITSRNIFGKEYTRTYLDNERVLLIDMYRDIFEVNDWQNIKTYPTENFILRNDIDFLNVPVSIFQISNLQGIVNGDGYTISNIEVNTNQGIFNELRGQVKNLYIENYTRLTSNVHDRFGVVGQAFLGSIMDNVHVTNVKVYSNNRMGGLVGYSDGMIIRNSSVTNITNQNLSGFIDVKVGGLVGEMHNTTLENSYSQSLDFDLSSARTVFSAGGLVGYAGGGSIQNAYANGNIKSNSENTGGIIGRNGCYINNTYSNVNIVSSADFVGGIAGFSANSNISNSLSLGSLYSNLNANNLRRIAGNIGISNNNYSWDKQHINGKIIGDVSGEQLLNKEDLANKLTYLEVIALSNNFNYDDLENGKLPKLMYTDGSKLLPNQEDNFLEEFEFEVLNIAFNKSISNVTVQLEFENPNNYQIIDLVVEDMSGVIKKNQNIDGTTIVEILLTPLKAFDSYRLSKIIYNDNGVEKTYNTNVKIEAQFYKDLEKFEDWQKISENDAENYRLIADIDFQGKTNINTDVVFNRLEGIGDEKKVLKNMEINLNGSDKSLIKAIYSNMNNIEFNNVSLNNTSTSNVSRNGLILYAFGEISNIDFIDINLNLSKSNYVGIISFDRTVDLRDINLNNITAKGRDYTSAFLAKSLIKGITNINFNTIDVYGTGSYVGGIIGHSDYTTTATVFHINGTNGIVRGTSSYVGGIFGYSGGIHINASNMSVTGAGSYTGGIAGYYSLYEIQYNTIENSEISNSQNYTGGLAGASYNVLYSNADTIRVNGTTSSSNYTGGLIGGGGYTIWYSGIKNSEINSVANYTGGIKGLLSHSTVHSSYVKDTSITGKNYVGGIVGGHQSVTSTVSRCITNATVTATETGAGGIIGYAANANTDSASNRIYLYHNIVANANVNANSLSGGLVGRVDKAFYPGHLYQNVVSASVFNNVNDNNNAIIGSSDYYSSGIQDLLIYNYTTINGQRINTENGLSEINLTTLDNLKQEITYTRIGFTTSYFVFDKLSNNFFPYLKNMVSKFNVYFELPILPDLITLEELYEQTKDDFNDELKYLIPEFEVYVSDVDKINIEFKDIDLKSFLTINNKTFKIDKNVFSFTYDFKDELNLTISKGNVKQDYTFNDLNKNIFTTENDYFLIKDSKLISNKDYKLNDSIINIYNNKILTDKRQVIDLTTEEVLYELDNNLVLLSEEIPLYKFEKNGMTIKNYYNYSVIDSKKINNQVFIKNGNIEMFNGGSNVYKESIIIDNYNNKKFLTVLSKDGHIYNLKDKISIPKKFDNITIKDMTNNLNTNTNLIAVEYENSGFIVFDYRNGEVLYKDFKNTNNIIEYFVNNLKIITNNNQEQQIKKDYRESINLINEVNKNNIIEDVTIADNFSLVPVYNKNTFEVYNISSLLENSANKNELETSINDVINNSPNLQEFYTNKKSVYLLENSFIYIFILILIGILVSTLILSRYLKNKRIN